MAEDKNVASTGQKAKRLASEILEYPLDSDPSKPVFANGTYAKTYRFNFILTAFNTELEPEKLTTPEDHPLTKLVYSSKLITNFIDGLEAIRNEIPRTIIQNLALQKSLIICDTLKKLCAQEISDAKAELLGIELENSAETVDHEISPIDHISIINSEIAADEKEIENINKHIEPKFRELARLLCIELTEPERSVN